MSCCNSNCNHDPCGSSFNQKLTMAAQYAQYAQTQANKAEDLWHEFNALYLGAFAVAPTQDNEGNPLQVGALYWNTGANELYAWNGLAWETSTGFNEFTPFLSTGSTTPRNLANRMADVVNVKDFGAIGDGNSHPLSSIYPTLAAAQAVYPFVTSLSQEIDWAAIQAAFNFVPASGGEVIIPKGTYILSSTLNISNKPISIFGAGIGISILKWTGVGMVGQNGINYTNTEFQPFLMEDLSLKAFPNTSNIAQLSGTALNIVYPNKETNLETTAKLSRVEIRAEIDLVTLQQKGGWTVCVYAKDAGRFHAFACNFAGTRKVNQIGIYLTTRENSLFAVVNNCDFTAFDHGIYSARISGGIGSPGGSVFESNNFTSCHKGITVDTFGDLIICTDNYMQIYKYGIYSQVRTSMIRGNRIDGVDDPGSLYPPSELFAIKLAVYSAGFVNDDSIISDNIFGRYSTQVMDGIILNSGWVHNSITGNIFGGGLAAPYGGTSLRYGVYLDPGASYNFVANNKVVKVNCLVLDAGSYNTVKDNVTISNHAASLREAPMPITGGQPILASGNSNITLNTSVILTQPSATSVYELYNGYSGQVLTIIAGDSNSTIVSSTASPNTIALSAGNWNMPLGSTLTILHTGSYWKEIGRTI